jgi:hypothetical protein
LQQSTPAVRERPQPGRSRSANDHLVHPIKPPAVLGPLVAGLAPGVDDKILERLRQLRRPPRLLDPERAATFCEAMFSGAMTWMTSSQPRELKAQSMAAADPSVT